MWLPHYFISIFTYGTILILLSTKLTWHHGFLEPWCMLQNVLVAIGCLKFILSSCMLLCSCLWAVLFVWLLVHFCFSLFMYCICQGKGRDWKVWYPYLTFIMLCHPVWYLLWSRYIRNWEPRKEHCMVFSLITKPPSAGYGRITKGKKHKLKYVMWPVSCITHKIDLALSAFYPLSGSLPVGENCVSLWHAMVWFCGILGIILPCLHKNRAQSQLPHHAMLNDLCCSNRCVVTVKEKYGKTHCWPAGMLLKFLWCDSV